MVEPIALIGFGCRFPGGADTPSMLWDLLKDPKNLSRKPPASRFNADAFYHSEGTHHGTTNATNSYFLEDDERSNVGHFDASFFNIQAGEVDSMDPQQRMLMEVVYDGLCASGQPMERLRGSDTSVFVGLMCDDYQSMLVRDWETFPRYTVTGVERGILANRLSYFFDWHGPSMTIDTACSSSMVALDQAVQVVRSGKSKMAVAAGANLILAPIMHINEASLGMLSPSGRCAMWDIAADGYTRGEGVAAVFVKTLSQALEDGDPIQAIIRETGVNQDGRTPGLTMPSSTAQAQLIRECYRRAGLDINSAKDRPQFFQAHGTGTQAGDPQEAEAITKAFFGPGNENQEKMLVGSIKTVIGHTEGTAGVASIIATALALKNGIIPPNLHFNNLSPKVAPFFRHLNIATKAVPWPTEEGQTKRATINCFGFGGTNTCVLLEEYVPSESETRKTTSELNYSPLVFSAHSESALRSMISWHLDFLKANPQVSLADLAFTLQEKRSTLTFRKSIPAMTVQDATKALERLVNQVSDDKTGLDTRYSTLSKPAKILGIFTGQGAQWPRMGAELIEKSEFVASRINDLDVVLQQLINESDRPSWTLKDQLLAGKDTSRIAEAALSQPLCTAVQIVLVDLLRAAGISFTAVVGHSSGEIGAAYAAGLVSAEDAIRIAYFRGVHAKLASSPNAHNPRGAMIAVGASSEDAQSVCNGLFPGRLQLAAVNSSSSVTLSGDEDAVDEAEAFFKRNGVFARKLKVDTAYHSAHMDSSAGPYLASLDGFESVPPTHPEVSTTWYSSVFQGEAMTRQNLSNQYWVDNMCNAVLFANALSKALEQDDDLDLAIEIGPHPALKGPAISTIGEIPYTGLLSRGEHDIEQLSAALGYVWTQLGFESVCFSAVQTLLSQKESKTVLADLPPYPFEHQRTYWSTSRLANFFKERTSAHAPNPVLGTLCTEATTTGELQWRNVLRQKELPWLKGHMLQGQTVFPATGYVSMAVEAVKAVAIANAVELSSISLLKLTDVDIPRAIAFDDDSTSVETIFNISFIVATPNSLSAEWACYSVSEGSSSVTLNAQGRAFCDFSQAGPDTLPSMKSSDHGTIGVNEKQFYENLGKVGYGYSAPFQGLSNIRRKLGYSIGTLTDQSGSVWEDGLLLHPGMMDSALQTVFAAWAYPGDPQIWSLHVPVSISSITVNPYFTAIGGGGKQDMLQFETRIRSKDQSKIIGDIYLHTGETSSHAFVQLEGATMVPFSPAIPRNDIEMFSHFQYSVASPNGELATRGQTLSPYDVQLYQDIDRVAYWYARHASTSIPLEDRGDLLLHFQHYLRWCDHMVDMVSRGQLPKVPATCNNDTHEDIAQILAQYPERKDIRFVEVVGDHLLPVILSGTSMLDHMNQDLLRAFYENGNLCAGPTNGWLASIVGQISRRYPGINILEVGAGTGATTSEVLEAVGRSYGSYTFTDISSGFFLGAEERFARQGVSRMQFQTFNMEIDPTTQGFTEGQFDVVVAVNVLHVSADMENTMSNIRRLLKPGGFVVAGELTSTNLLFTGMTAGTLPGWWIGAESGRPWGPLLDLAQWDATLKNTGFAGVDTTTPDISASLPFSVWVAQAVDDQVTMLRNPLAIAKYPGINTKHLAIIGGAKEVVRNLGQQVSDVLAYRFRNKQFFSTVEDFAGCELALSGAAMTVLCLTDLDEPYLENMTVGKFAAIKTLFAAAGTLIWTTCGSRDGSPYHYMTTGLINTIKTEYLNLTAQVYDLDAKVGIQHDTATSLAQMLLRQLALRSWDRDVNELLWTAETQIYVENGRENITRLLPDTEKNQRYNSRRRDVLVDVSPAEEKVELLGSNEGGLELCTVSPLRLAQNETSELPQRTIWVLTSLLQTVAVGSAGFFRPCIGIDVQNSAFVVALSNSSESPATIPSQLCVAISEEDALSTSALLSLAGNLVAEKILLFSSEGSTLLVNNADVAVQNALESKASSKNVNVVFTTVNFEPEKTARSLYLHPGYPQQVMQSMIPQSTAVFVHFSRGARSDAVCDAISCYLPTACVAISEAALVGRDVKTFSSPDLASKLQEAWSISRKTLLESTESISLKGITEHKAIGEPLTVVDWATSKSVTAKVQPIDSGTLFFPNKTYVFVGMAGELAQSLAGWMIAHGAKYVVLTSRTPKVHPIFIKDMEKRYGAVVRAMSLDVTSRDAIQAFHATVEAQLPPIAGIINGAMILDDEILPNMTLEQWNRVAKPKVLGTQLLDEVFHDDTALEFFICCSSISSVIGWSGQSNYTAANDYMTSLMSQRRNRGVVGSSISIPAVLGVGYAANSDTFDFEYIKSIGYINIGEEDLHTLFAEAILSGRPGQNDKIKSQIAMGVNYIPVDLDVRQAHRRDVRLSHFIHREGNSLSGKNDVKASLRVQIQLQVAKTEDEAFAISRDGFLSHLRRMLRIPKELKIHDAVKLMDLGVDSLVAVEIRSWFKKEMEVDVPTLKILGGGSIADLVNTALEKRNEKKEQAALASAKSSSEEQSGSSSPLLQIGGSDSLVLSPKRPPSSGSSEPDTDLPTPLGEVITVLDTKGIPVLPAVRMVEKKVTTIVTEIEINPEDG